MAEIVLGVGTSHSPMLAMSAEMWLERAKDDRQNAELNLSDGRFVSYQELANSVGDRYATNCTPAVLEQQSTLVQAHLDRLAAEIEAAKPDVVVVIGDDHGEMFAEHSMPAVAVFYGEELVMHPWANSFADPPAWFDSAMRGYAMDAPHRFKAPAEFARKVIDGLLERDVDVSGVGNVPDPEKAGVGHAFGFVIERLLKRREIPVLPVFLNTYYKPNVVRPRRCIEIGQKLKAVIEEIPGDTRVAIIASGGLSHFVTDEGLDRRVLDALEHNDQPTLAALPMGALNSGSSEILCWVAGAGAFEDLAPGWSEYVPVYRTPAGTGCGLAFVTWRPRALESAAA